MKVVQDLRAREKMLASIRNPRFGPRSVKQSSKVDLVSRHVKTHREDAREELELLLRPPRGISLSVDGVDRRNSDYDIGRVKRSLWS